MLIMTKKVSGHYLNLKWISASQSTKHALIFSFRCFWSLMYVLGTINFYSSCNRNLVMVGACSATDYTFFMSNRSQTSKFLYRNLILSLLRVSTKHLTSSDLAVDDLRKCYFSVSFTTSVVLDLVITFGCLGSTVSILSRLQGSRLPGPLGLLNTFF